MDPSTIQAHGQCRANLPLDTAATMSFTAIISTFFIAAMVCSCSKPVEQSDIPGLYTVHCDTNSDQIQINSNGTYVHTQNWPPSVKSPDKTNKWTLRTVENGTEICFNNFVFTPGLQTLLGQENRPVYWFVRVERRGGTLGLRLHPDLNCYYVKKIENR